MMVTIYIYIYIWLPWLCYSVWTLWTAGMIYLNFITWYLKGYYQIDYPPLQVYRKAASQKYPGWAGNVCMYVCTRWLHRTLITNQPRLIYQVPPEMADEKSGMRVVTVENVLRERKREVEKKKEDPDRSTDSLFASPSWRLKETYHILTCQKQRKAPDKAMQSTFSSRTWDTGKLVILERIWITSGKQTS